MSGRWQYVPLLFCVALGLYAVSFWLGNPSLIRLLGWFVGAAVLHDLVFLPLYTAVDRAVTDVLGAADRRAGAPPTSLSRRGRTMYVRVPTALSGLLLLVWFPLISGRVASYESATGLSADGFLARWLLITAVLFGGSALLLVLRLRRATKQRPPADH